MEKVAIGPNGEKTVYKLAQDASGNQYWQALEAPPETASNYTKQQFAKFNEDFGSMLKNAGKVLTDDRPDAAKLRDQDASSLGPLDSAMIEAGKVATGFGTGAKEAFYNARGLGKYLLGSQESGIQDRLKAMEMANTRADEAKLLKEFEESPSAAATIGRAAGGMLPYILTSTLAGPAANKIASKTLSGIERTVDLGKVEAKSLLERGVNAAADSGMPGISQFGKKAQVEWVQKLKDLAAESAKQPVMRQPYRVGALSDVLGSTILGGVEGALNSDLNVQSGAEAGLAGGMLGRALKYKLEPAPLPDKPAYNELMARRQAWGRRNTPGEVLDSPVLQKRESGYRNDDRTSQMMKYFDEANQKADNRYAFEAMGYTGDSIDKAALNAHVAKLGAEYNDLAGKTTARLTKNDLNDLYQHTVGLAGQASDEGVKASKLANEWLKKMQTFRKQQNFARRPSGQADYQVQGKTWQDLRSELKEDINAAYERSEPKVGAALKPFLSKLNSAAETGISRLGKTPEESAAILANWRDLDERFAMSKILKEHGLDDITLNVSPTKLYNYFKGDNPERFITGNWGKNTRINRLYDVAEGRPLDLELAGSTLSSDNVKDAAKRKQTLRGQLASSADELKPGVLDEMALRLYLSPRLSPKVNGWSFGALNSETPGALGGVRKTGTYTRSLAQSTQFTPKLVDAIENAISSTYGFMQHPLDATRDWWKGSRQ